MRTYVLFPDPAGERDRTIDQALAAMLVTTKSVRQPMRADVGGGLTITCNPDDTLAQLQARCAALVPEYEAPTATPDFIPGPPAWADT